MSPRAAVPVHETPRVTPLSIEYVPLESVAKWPGNPKAHDIGAIAASVLKFGFRDPISVNRRNNFIEEGHGRIDTLRGLHSQRRPAPAFIQADPDTNTWFVPVLYFDDDELTQHGYALAHNRTQELGGGYDDAALLAALTEQAMSGTLDGIGFDTDDLDALRRRLQEGAEDERGDLRTSFQVLITCASEQEQTDLLERFTEEGLSVRALVT